MVHHDHEHENEEEEPEAAPQADEVGSGDELPTVGDGYWKIILMILLTLAAAGGVWFWLTGDSSSSSPSGHAQALEERNAQLERELEAAKRAPPVCDDQTAKLAGRMIEQAPEAQLPSRMPAEQVRVVVDNTIYLTLAGQRQTKLPLSAVEWSQPVSIPSTALGVAPVNVNFEIMPAVGFKARVLDDLTPPGMPYREVSVPRDGSLPVAGLRRIEFKAMTAGQQAVVRISD